MITTNVTATITDLDGQTWNNGRFTFTLYNFSSPNGPFINGGVTLTSTQLIVTGSMTAAGVISTTLLDLSQTQPYGSVYLVTLCSNTSASCASAPSISPAGASQDFSASLSAGLAGPRIYAGPNAKAYSNTELLGPASPGQVYFNVNTNVQMIWTGSAWAVNSGTSTGSGISTLTGDVNASGSGSVVGTVVGLNGTNLVSLGAGLLKQNASGIPAIAVAGTDYASISASNSFSASNVFSAPSAANTSSLVVNSPPFTGGTGTTTKPATYLDSGAAEPTTWNTSGTTFGINSSSAFAGNFIDCHINGGASLFSVNSTGSVIYNNWIMSGIGVQATTTIGVGAGVTPSLNTEMTTTGLTMGISNSVKWVTTANMTGAVDTVVSRQAAGVVQVGSGTTNNSTGSLKLGQLLGGSGTPTIAVGAGAGTGATVTVTGNNNAGSINLTTGTSPASGVLATLTFNVAGTYPTAPYVSLTAGNSATAGVLEYVTSTTTTFVLNVGTALTASTQYIWNFLVMG